MSGLLRRFRRAKPKEEEEEPAETPAVPAAEDTDIYPHRAPERRGDPDIEPEPEPRPEVGGQIDEAAVGPPRVEDEIGPAPTVETSAGTAPEPPASEPSLSEPAPLAPVAEVPLSPRPPLPEAEAGAGRSAHRPLTATTRCFLCGTEMNGSFCPTCRMTWND
jgi:hypothetical protein